jgi:hypothetical protein
MFAPADGPAVYTSVTVGTSAVQLKVGASEQEERVLISIQPLDDDLYLGYSNSVTTSIAAIKVFKGQYVELERGEFIQVWAISPTAGNSVLVSEVS